MMSAVIDNPTSCEICPVIRLLNAKNTSATEIDLELYTVYGQNTINE
jgi:hypothetical protein